MGVESSVASTAPGTTALSDRGGLTAFGAGSKQNCMASYGRLARSGSGRPRCSPPAAKLAAGRAWGGDAPPAPPRRPRPAHTGRAAPPTAARPAPFPPPPPPQVGRPAPRTPRPPRPPQVGPRGPPCWLRPRRVASPPLLAGGGGGGRSAASLDIFVADPRAGASRPTAVEAADPRGPLGRAPPPRLGRPRGPAASLRARPPGGCSHVAGAGGGEPAHGEHLPGKRARGGQRLRGFERRRPGDCGDPGVRGRRDRDSGGAGLEAGGAGRGPEPCGRRGSGLQAGEAGRPRGRLAAFAGEGRDFAPSGRGGDLARDCPPLPPFPPPPPLLPLPALEALNR